MLDGLGRMLAATAVLLGAGTTSTGVEFGGLGLVLAIIGAIGGLGAATTAAVLLYKARSEKGLTEAQKLEVLFERQRQVNMDLIGLRDDQITELRRKLAEAETKEACEEVRRQLEECERDRLGLRNQVRGLEQTLVEIRGEHA